MPDASSTSSTPVLNNSSAFSPIGDLISKSWEMVKLTWKNLLILSIVLWVVGIVLGIIAGGAIVGSFALSGTMGEMAGGAIVTAFGIGILVVVGILVLSSVFGTGMMIAVAEAEQKPAIGSLISRGFKLFVPVFFTSLLMIFFIYGGFFFLIIPGLVIAILTGFSIYEVIFTENRYMAAIKNSVKMVSQNFGELFVRVLVVFGLMIGLVIVQAILQNMTGGEEAAAAPLISLVMSVVQMVFGWFAMCYYFLLYTEARNATNFEKSASVVWIWVVSILGWALGILLLVAASAAIGSILESYSNFDAQNSGDMERLMLDESGEVNTDQLLEEYGQDMTEEEKEMFRQMMENAGSAIEEDQEAAQQEADQPI